MGFTGDIGAVRELTHRVEGLSNLPARSLERISQLLELEVEGEFSAGIDPYGNAWADLADSTIARGRHPPPLTDSGIMRSSIKVAPASPHAVLITIDHPALPHQDGWNGRQGSGPARPMVPEREIPTAWAADIEAAVDEVFRT